MGKENPSGLQETLKHAIEDNSTLECVLASTRVDKIMEPTILVTCLNSAHMNIVEEKLRKASCIPSYLRHRVLPFEVILCATADSCVVPEPRVRTGRRVELSLNEIDEMGWKSYLPVLVESPIQAIMISL